MSSRVDVACLAHSFALRRWQPRAQPHLEKVERLELRNTPDAWKMASGLEPMAMDYENLQNLGLQNLIRTRCLRTGLKGPSKGVPKAAPAEALVDR